MQRSTVRLKRYLWVTMGTAGRNKKTTETVPRKQCFQRNTSNGEIRTDWRRECRDGAKDVKWPKIMHDGSGGEGENCIRKIWHVLHLLRLKF